MYEVDTKELKHLMIDTENSTIEALSNATGVNRNTLSGVVNGSIYPSSMVMQKIADALNMTSEQAGRIFFVKKLTPDASFEEKENG